MFSNLLVREEKPVPEKDLEAKLIRHIEDFLLELGCGFMFAGSRQHVTLGNRHYFADMVFYNKILKAYDLIDLKIGLPEPTHIGQMKMTQAAIIYCFWRSPFFYPIFNWTDSCLKKFM
jgi:predicted nuclease of restriction endonuclease-like (RecB) superfamily